MGFFASPWEYIIGFVETNRLIFREHQLDGRDSQVLSYFFWLVVWNMFYFPIYWE